MKQRSRVVLVIVSAVVAAVFANASPLSAESIMSDWVTTDKIDHQYLPDYNSQKCTWETWSIATDPNRLYSRPEQSDPHEICIYRQPGFLYAHYTRTVGAGSFAWDETGLAIAVGEDTATSVLTPIDSFNPDIIPQSYSGDLLFFTSTETYYGFYAHSMKNFSSQLEYDANHNVYKVKAGATVDTLRYGDRSFRFLDKSVSNNGKWLIMVGPGSMVRYNLATQASQVVAVKVFDRLDFSPRYGMSPFVSNDGNTMGVAGLGTGFWIIEGDDRCIKKTDEQRPDDWGGSPGPLRTYCPSRDITDIVYPYATKIGGYQRLASLQASNDATIINYSDGTSWQQISYGPRPLMQYLALGDSFAAGEGDLTYNGANYLAGTDVDGNSSLGIPREKCHLSKRSYPMLLGMGMSLQYGTDFRSVACSGAVKSDILSANIGGGVDASYLGQATAKFGFGVDSGPRLQGLSNAQALQDDARDDFTSGRVQQIEFVKKTKPKVLTVMIGGNDVSFASALTKCVMSANLNVRFESECDLGEGQLKEDKAQEIYNQYAQLKQFYQTLKEASPGTKIYVIGYPKFFDDESNCTGQLVFGKIRAESRKGINQLLNYLNATIRSAANDAGVTYIDIADALGAHAMCGDGTAINGVNSSIFAAVMTEYMKYKTEVADKNIEQYGQVGGTAANMNILFLKEYADQRAAEKIGNAVDGAFNPAIALDDLTAQLMHPNATGHQLMYDYLSQRLGPDLLYGSVCDGIVVCSDGVQHGPPDVDSYVAGVEVDSHRLTKDVGDHIILEADGVSAGVTLRLGDEFEVRIENDLSQTVGQPYGSSIGVQIHSTPVNLGQMTAQPDGSYVLRATIPKNLDVGWHTLHLVGSNEDGYTLDIYRWVFVLGSDEDMDGDGVLDDVDTCAFGAGERCDLKELLGAPAVEKGGLRSQNKARGSSQDFINKGWAASHVFATNVAALPLSNDSEPGAHNSLAAQKGVDQNDSNWSGLAPYVAIVGLVVVVVLVYVGKHR